jgi:hypothetical protein
VGNGEGTREGSADVTDMHPYPHLREAIDRSRRADLKRSACKLIAHFSTHRPSGFACRHFSISALTARGTSPWRAVELQRDVLPTSGEAYTPLNCREPPAGRSVLTSFSCCLFFHILRVVAGACGAVHLRPVVECLLGRLDLAFVSAPDLHWLSLQRPRVGERELPRQTPV